MFIPFRTNYIAVHYLCIGPFICLFIFTLILLVRNNATRLINKLGKEGEEGRVKKSAVYEVLRSTYVFNNARPTTLFSMCSYD